MLKKKWTNDAITPQCTPNCHSRMMHWILDDHIWCFNAPDAAPLLIHIGIEMNMNLIQKYDFLNKIVVHFQLLYYPNGEVMTNLMVISL